MNGFVYAVAGAKYIEEARLSAQSVRRFHQEPIVLITDREVAKDGFDEVIVVPDFLPRYGAKIAMRHCRFERYIYLDCDCRMIGPVAELFQLLDAFDLALPAALGGYHYQLDNCSPAFREHSTHMMAVRRNAATEAFFRAWAGWYRHYESEMQGEGDQRSFRRAAYEAHDLRLCTLSDEWALSAYPGGLLCMDVRIVHARPTARLDELERNANQRLAYRAFLPPFPPIYEPHEMTVKDWLRLLGAGGLQVAKNLKHRLQRR